YPLVLLDSNKKCQGRLPWHFSIRYIRLDCFFANSKNLGTDLLTFSLLSNQGFLSLASHLHSMLRHLLVYVRRFDMEFSHRLLVGSYLLSPIRCSQSPFQGYTFLHPCNRQNSSEPSNGLLLDQRH